MQDGMKSKNRNRNIVIVFAIGITSLLVEIFLCNANSFRIRDRDKFEAREYTLEDLQISGADVDPGGGADIQERIRGKYFY